MECEKTQTRRVNDVKRILLKTCRMDLTTVIDSTDFSYGKADEAITEIYTDGNLNIRYLPLNPNENYPNLISMSFWLCGVRSVSKSNFIKLSKLRRLALNQNRLSIIEDNTFEDLVALEYLYLDNNRIIQIDGQSMVPLKSLKHLDIYSNKCISTTFFGANQVATIPKTITEVCSSYVTFQACERMLNNENELKHSLEKNISAIIAYCKN